MYLEFSWHSLIKRSVPIFLNVVLLIDSAKKQKIKDTKIEIQKPEW